jgi:NADH dehydrogenase 1 beta subcomplex subunit 2
MFIARTTASLRNVLRTPTAIQTRQMSGGQWSYRVNDYKPSRNLENVATAIGAFTWSWILFGIWKEPDHILGEFPYPDAAKWTDEELGIPPDDE